MNILEQFKSYITAENEKEQKEKTSFWPSDSNKDKFEIYHAFKGTPPSNPFDAETLVMFDVGKNIERSVVKTLSAMGLTIVPEEEKEQHRIDMEREGVKITGYIDALTIEGGKEIPIEIKSWYGDMQESELDAGIAKENYVKQLSMYMDFKNADKGYLFYVGRAKGKCYLFTVTRNGNVYSCNNLHIDITAEYKRFKMIKDCYIDLNIEPDSDYTYKFPIDSIDWSKLTTSKISNARNGHAVIGNWQVLYSTYKNMIVAKEAAKYGRDLDGYLGYSDAEKAKICELTAGFTSKKKKV